MQPKQLIKDVTFDFEADKTSCGPHIAYTLPSQGGAASGLNVSYLFKSEDVSETTIKEAQEIKKAMNMQKKKSLLRQALVDSYCDKDEWLCVEDWNDTEVFFSMGDWDSFHMLVTSYTESPEGIFKVGDTAKPVVEVFDYVAVEGKLKLSEEAESKLESGVYEIVMKAISTPEAQEKLSKQLNKSVTSEVKPEVEPQQPEMENLVEQKDILKSSEVQALIAAEIAKATQQQNARIEELEKARQELIKQQEETEKAQMLEVFKGYSFVSEEEAVALTEKLFKSEASVLVMDILEKAKDAMSTLASEEVGVEAEVQVDTNLEKSKSRVAEILKARKSAKK